MKAALIMAHGISQIMLSPENDFESHVLGLITPDKNISVDIQRGTLFDDRHVPPSARGYIIEKCRAGYLRAYKQRDAVMLVLRPKNEEAITPAHRHGEAAAGAGAEEGEA